MDIDVSKENIQPLRGGRNLVQLGTALQAQSDLDAQRQLQLQKEEHEAAIRNYEGPDPLEPWFNYIQWIEQSFPKHGHEGHIDKLIKDCLQIFEKDERYFQDRRFVKLWIKYIDCLTNPLEVYQRLHSCRIGVECSEFYRAWACYCEESGEYKKANQVYTLGLQVKAQPLDELEQAHMNFQLFYAQRMLNDDSPTKRKAASALAETRMALTSLKSFKRRNIANVPVQRIGENVKSITPGIVRQQPGCTNANKPPNSNIMINVYEETPSTSRIPLVNAADNLATASLVQSCGNVENEKEVGIWTNAKTKMVHSNVVPHQPLPFIPYEEVDQNIVLSANHEPYCLDDLNFTVPLCIPDPPDPTKIPSYNKAKVYVDDTEFSLEEIRARKYKIHMGSGNSSNVLTEPFITSTSEQIPQCSALETLANCALDAEQDQLAQLMPLTIPTLQNITKVQNIHSPGEPKILVNLDSKEFSELSNPKVKKCDENMKSELNKDNALGFEVYVDENAVSNYDKNVLVKEFNKSHSNNFLGDSVTVNTKEARWELRNIFNDNEPSMVQPVVQQLEIPFDIHEDRSITMALHTQKKHMFQEEVAAKAHKDKENANKFPVQLTTTIDNVNKTGYYEEPSCTQVFNFNIKNSSTPNTSHFKRPASYLEHTNKITAVPKFNIEVSAPEEGVNNVEVLKKEEIPLVEVKREQAQLIENQGFGLSVIMETTREANSKSSGSSSSGHQSQIPYSERTQASNYDSTYSHQNDLALSKRNSLSSSQPRLPNGQFMKVYQRPQVEPKVATPSAAMPYLHDHQYQKPMPSTAYTHRTISHGYQQNYNVAYQSPYGSNQTCEQGIVQQIQQGYGSPSVPNCQSPQHPGIQSPHHVASPTPIQPGFQSPTSVQPGFQSPTSVQPGFQSPTSVQPGFQSPTQPYAHAQISYHSPAHQVQNNPQGYSNVRQDYHQADYGAQVARQNVYVNQPQLPVGFQSPPHQSQYPANQYYQRSSYINPQASPGYAQPNYHVATNQYAPSNSYDNQQVVNSNYNTIQTAYRQPKPTNDHSAYTVVNVNNMSYQIYQSPNHAAQSNVRNTSHNTTCQEKVEPMQTSLPGYHAKNEITEPNQYFQQQSSERQVVNRSQQKRESVINHESFQKEIQNTKGSVKQLVPNKSPTSALRNVRHEQPYVKPNQNSSDIGFSNQFLNFITARNEPKDNANTPKFSNSPSISHKMHKNLYVSSPEQAQIPPSSGNSDSDSKDGLTMRSVTPIQSAKMLQTVDKQKDTKRHLDFEQRVELQSEDSRDSVSKESRISSVHSRQSDLHSDGYGMDCDSENSMECSFKSTHSISLVETCDIRRPADIEFPRIIDPFNKKLLHSLLDYVKFPNKTHADGYVEVRSIPKIQVGTLITVGNNKFSIEKQLGKGNYGAVFLCLDVLSNKSVAVKYQKPSRPWEFYICQEIKARIKDPFMLPGYMDITTSFLADNASLFVSEYSKYGSLLDVANKVRLATSKCINEHIVFLLTSEMLSIVHYLHKAEIIHADIKPDNFLLMKIPTQEWRTPSLQLIDLGCAVDMSLFPDGTTFREMIATEGFTCTEMREGKPWTYQTDLYCLAGTIHVILMGSYMKVVNRVGQWNIDKKLPRYMKINLWDKIFTTLLNVPDCNTLPDLMDLKNDVDTLLRSLDNLGSQLRNLANVLKSR